MVSGGAESYCFLCSSSWVGKHIPRPIEEKSQALTRPQSRTMGQGASACGPVGYGSLGNQAGLCPAESSLCGGPSAGACSPSAPGIIRTSERTALTQG